MEKEKKWERYQNATRYFEQKATPYKAAVVRPLTSYLKKTIQDEHDTRDTTEKTRTNL